MPTPTTNTRRLADMANNRKNDALQKNDNEIHSHTSALLWYTRKLKGRMRFPTDVFVTALFPLHFRFISFRVRYDHKTDTKITHGAKQVEWFHLVLGIHRKYG